eukprot:6811219-Lingulodinium_polyedra.AAC.1
MLQNRRSSDPSEARSAAGVPRRETSRGRAEPAWRERRRQHEEAVAGGKTQNGASGPWCARAVE